MPKYECAVVLTTKLTDEQIQEQTEQIKNWIAAFSVEPPDVDVWGRKRLAYSIQKETEGFYLIYYFAIEQAGDYLRDLTRRMRTSEAILRHLIVRLPALKETPRVPKEEEVVEKPVKPAESEEAKDETPAEPGAEPSEGADAKDETPAESAAEPSEGAETGDGAEAESVQAEVPAAEPPEGKEAEEETAAVEPSEPAAPEPTEKPAAEEPAAPEPTEKLAAEEPAAPLTDTPKAPGE